MECLGFHSWGYKAVSPLLKVVFSEISVNCMKFQRCNPWLAFLVLYVLVCMQIENAPFGFYSLALRVEVHQKLSLRGIWFITSVNEQLSPGARDQIINLNVWDLPIAFYFMTLGKIFHYSLCKYVESFVTACYQNLTEITYEFHMNYIWNI